MRLNELIERISCEVRGDPAVEIKGLQYDSRQVGRGDVFFCIRGFAADGHKFAAKAVEAGAAALIVEEFLPLECVQIKTENTREAMALMASKYYGDPASSMRMIGVTGTNGKTSITYMLKAVFERRGEKVGLIGTIVNMIGDEKLHTERTTPESLDLQALLAKMRDEGCTTVVMEVSSHSLVLGRVAGIEFEGAIFTNLTQDHLDFHKTFEEYAAAKRILFEHAAVSAINADDKYGEFMAQGAKGSAVTYGINNKADYMARDIQLSPEHARFVLAADSFRIPLLMQIPGMFTVYNALAAAAMLVGIGVEMIYIKQGLEGVSKVVGRFERLPMRGRDCTVILDYCHTPDSLESTLRTARGFTTGRLVCVFGCGGNRDAKKRPIMGGIAARMSDFAIVTSDNPRFEEPMDIIAQIEEGMEGAKYITIENRRAAIKYAIENAKEGDVIILAGKGHEDYQEIRGVKHPFDEKVVVQELLDELEAEGK